MTKKMLLQLFGMCLFFGGAANAVDGAAGVPVAGQSAASAALANRSANPGIDRLRDRLAKRKAEKQARLEKSIDDAQAAYDDSMDAISRGRPQLRHVDRQARESEDLKVNQKIDLCLGRLRKASGTFVAASQEGEWIENAIRMLESLSTMYQLDRSYIGWDLPNRLVISINSYLAHLEELRNPPAANAAAGGAAAH